MYQRRELDIEFPKKKMHKKYLIIENSRLSSSIDKFLGAPLVFNNLIIILFINRDRENE